MIVVVLFKAFQSSRRSGRGVLDVALPESRKAKVDQVQLSRGLPARILTKHDSSNVGTGILIYWLVRVLECCSPHHSPHITVLNSSRRTPLSWIKMPSIGISLLCFPAILLGAGAFISDFNETHVYNQNWPPHARFHNGQTMSMAAALGAATLWYTSSSPNIHCRVRSL